MRKLISIFLAVVMLAGMMTVAIPVSAETSEVTYDSLEKQLADNPEADKFYIEDADDYKYFMSVLADVTLTGTSGNTAANLYVAAGEGAFAGKTVHLVNDIVVDSTLDADDSSKYGSRSNTANVDDRYRGFSGTFDGHGYSVSGLCVVGTSAGAGSLFGYVTGTASIKNVTFKNCYIQNANPGLAGLVCSVTNGSTCTIENVELASDFVLYSARTSALTNGYTGGFVGNVGAATLTIRNSVFCGVITRCSATERYSSVAGLVGGVITPDGATQAAVCNIINSGFLGNYAWINGTTTYTGNSKCVGRIENLGSDTALVTTVNITNCIAGGTDNGNLHKIMTGMLYPKNTGTKVAVSIKNSVFTPVTNPAGTAVTAWLTGVSAGSGTVSVSGNSSSGAVASGSDLSGTDAYLKGDTYNSSGAKNGTADLTLFWVATEGNPMPRAIEEKVQPGTLKYDFLMCEKELYIKTAEDYVYFFNNKSLFAKDQTIYLANDITLNPGWTSKIVDVIVPAQPGEDGEMGTADDVPETTTKGIDKTGLTVELNTVKDSGFIGTFDGKGNTIRGAYATGGTTDGAALIGRVNGGTIKNVKFENCAVEAKVVRTGGLVSVAAGVSTIENVVADIDVVGNGNCGGIVALTVNSNATKTYLTNVVYNGEIVATGSNVGGLVGCSWDDSATYLTNCAFYGSITAPDGAAAGKLVGASSAGTTEASAMRDMESEIVITGCIAAGTANYDTYINGALVGQCEFADRCVETIEPEGKDPVNCAEKSHKITITITNSLFTPMDEEQKATGVCVMSPEVEANVNNDYTVTDNSVAGDANYLDGGFSYVGYQVKEVDGGYSIRFIGQGDDLSINEVGMTVAASGGNLADEYVGSKATTKVYGGLIVGEEGGDDDYMAPEGSYVYTMNVGTFTADMGVITVNVTMFAKVGEAQFVTSVRTVTIDTAKLPAFAGVAEA